MSVGPWINSACLDWLRDWLWLDLSVKNHQPLQLGRAGSRVGVAFPAVLASSKRIITVF